MDAAPVVSPSLSSSHQPPGDPPPAPLALFEGGFSHDDLRIGMKVRFEITRVDMFAGSIQRCQRVGVIWSLAGGVWIRNHKGAAYPRVEASAVLEVLEGGEQ